MDQFAPLTSSSSAPLTWRAMEASWSRPQDSRFVQAGGVRWHVQDTPCTVQRGSTAPTLLLVHGAGASTHSWRDCVPGLAAHFRVIAIDLPGHAFTDSPAVYRPTLPRVSALVGELLGRLGLHVDLVVGHSAGAAILSRMVLDNAIQPKGLVSFNGAFQPFDGAAGTLFPAIAKMLFVNPLVPRLFALGGRNEDRVERLITGTGSQLDAKGLWFYQQLMQSPRHIEGVLAMMANWDLEPLMGDLRRMPVPLLLVAGQMDKAVPPRVAEDVGKLCPEADIERWSGLGHLAHEEDPGRAADSILSFAGRLGLLDSVDSQAGEVRRAV